MTKKEESKQIDTGDKKESKETDGKKKEVLKDDKGVPLSEADIALFKRYGKGPYSE